MNSSSKKGGAQASPDQESTPIGAPSWVLLILLAVLPAAFATGLSNFESLKELLLVGGMGVALVMWGISVLRRGRLKVAPGRVAILGVVFAFYTLGATLWASNRLWGVWESLHFVALAAAVLIIVAPIGRGLRFRDFALASGVGGLAAAICGLLDLAGVGLFTVVWNPAGPTGAFDAMEFGAAYFAVALPILWVGALRTRGKERIFMAISLILSSLYFALLGGWIWTAILAAVCVLSAFVVGAFRRPHSLRVIVPAVVLSALVGVLAGGVYLGFGPSPAPTEATQLPRLVRVDSLNAEQLAHRGARGYNLLFSADRTESVRGLQAHAYLASVGLELFSDNPLLGNGAGAWWPNQTQFLDSEHEYIVHEFERYPAFRSPHNGATKLLVEYGAVGFLLFVIWVFAIFAVALGGLMKHPRAAQDDRDDQAKTDSGWVVEHWAMLSAALIGVVFMLFTPLLSLAPAALIWVVGLGVLARVSAEYSGFSGWSTAWHMSARNDGSGQASGALKAGALLSVLIGLGVLVPTVLQAGASYHRGQADQWMRATEYERAIDAYESSQRWYPASGDVPLNISQANSRLGQLEASSDWVDRAVSMRPYDARALTLKGRLSLGKLDAAETIALGNRAVAAFPNSIAARKLLISALELQERYKEAVEQAEAMVARKPPTRQRSELEQLIGNLESDFLRNPSKAKKHYLEAIKYTGSSIKRKKLSKKIEKMDEAIKAQRRRLDGESTPDEPADEATDGPFEGPSGVDAPREDAPK